jgi:hypothetical protein
MKIERLAVRRNGVRRGVRAEPQRLRQGPCLFDGADAAQGVEPQGEQLWFGRQALEPSKGLPCFARGHKLRAEAKSVPK